MSRREPTRSTSTPPGSAPSPNRPYPTVTTTPTVAAVTSNATGPSAMTSNSTSQMATKIGIVIS